MTTNSQNLAKRKMKMGESFTTVSIRVPTPDGTAFVQVIEDDTGKPIQLIINIGKAGVPLSAWAEAVARLCTLLLQNGAGINNLIQELSLINSDKSTVLPEGSIVRSGPAGIVTALMKYRHAKFQELKANLGTYEDYDEGPRLATG